MSVGERVLSVIYKGDAKSLMGASKDAEGAVGGLGSKLATVGKVVAGATVALGAAAIGFAAKSADTFARVGGEVSKVVRYTGLTAEAASRLRFAAGESGVGVDQLTRSLGILSKNSVGKSLDKLKLGLKDAHGAALPLNDQLLKLAEKFKSMPAGAEKNALALKIFGKSGMDMLPFLNKGAAGIAELEKQSDKLGQTLSQKGLDAVKASTMAHREFSAAMEGLQLQIGQYVLPIITKLVTFFTELLTPAIKVVADLASKYLAPAIDFAFGVMSNVMGAVSTFVTGTLMPAVSTVFTFLADLVVKYVVPAFQWGFGIVRDVARIVADFFTGTLLPAVRGVLGKIEEAVAPFAEKARKAFDSVRAFIEDKFLPALKTKLTPALQDLIALIGDHLPTALATGGVGIGALALHLSGAAGSIGSVIAAVALLPNPVVLVIAAVAALVTGFIILYTHSQVVRDTLAQIGRFIVDKVVPAVLTLVDFIVTKVVPAFVSFGKRVFDVEKFFVDHLIPVFNKLLPVVVDSVQGFLGISAAIADKVLPFLGKLAKWLDDHTPIVEVFAVLVGTTLALAFVAWGVSATIAGGQAVAALVASAIESTIAAGSMILDLAAVGVMWLASAADATLAGAEMAAAWLIGLGPIGLIVAAVAAAAILIIVYWDSIKNAASAVWQWIKDHWELLFQILTGPIGTAVLFIKGHWQTIKDDVMSVVNFVAKVGETIWDGLSAGLGGVVSGIEAALQAMIRFVIRIVNDAIQVWNDIPFHKDIKKIGDPAAGLIASGPHAGQDPHHLAAGGIVRRTVGGVLARIGEGGDNEAVIPLSAQGLRPLIDGIMQRLRNEANVLRSAFGAPQAQVATYAASSGREVHVHVDVNLTGAYVTDPAGLMAVVRRELADLRITNTGF